MKRRNGSGRFTPEGSAGEDINPMDGVANLADVMLVFACGLMLALITYWNVDVASTTVSTVDTAPGVELTEEIFDADSSQEQHPDLEGLEQYGMLYRDPVTGKLYFMSGESID